MGKRILVLGANGRVGRHVVQQATAAGYAVRVLVRNRATFEDNVEVAVGDPLSSAELAPLLNDVTSVVVSLGLRRRTDSMWSGLVSPPDVVERAARALVTSAAGTKVHVVTVSAHGVRESWASLPWLVRQLINMSQVHHSYADHAAQERVLEKSDLPLLIVRPTILTDDDSMSSFEVRDLNALPMTARISRSAVARFIVSSLENQRTGLVTLSGQAN